MINTLPKRPTGLTNQCAVCGLKTTFGCSQCKQVFYCSAEHQRQHWSIHQLTCNNQKAVELLKPPQEDPLLKSTINPMKSKNDTSANVKSDKKLAEKQINEKDQLAEDHDKFRQIAIRLISQKDFSDAIVPLKKAIDVATKLENQGNKEQFFEKAADQILLSRVYINLYEFENSRRLLILVFEQLQLFIKNTSNKQDQIRVCGVLKVMAQLFYQTGDQKNCELVYVEYTTLIESSYGENSQSTGNAYFLVGVFYLQHKHYTQALACFKRALNIKLNINSQDEGVSDCYYNMGIIYKQSQKKDLAFEFLDRALKLRRQIIGDNSMQVAICLETIGKLHLINGELKQAYQKLQECFNIRKSLIKDPNHPELERISKLILSLYSKTQEQIIGGQRNSKIQPQISQMYDRLSAQIMENNLNKIIDQDVQESMDPFFLEQSSIQQQSDLMRRQRNKSLKQQNKKSEDKSQEIEEKFLMISAAVLESLGIDQLILFKQLQGELKNQKNKQEHKQMIIDSQFINSLSQIQFNLIRESNPQIFGYFTNDEQVSDQESEQMESSQQQLGESNLKMKPQLEMRMAQTPSNQSTKGKIQFR